LVGVPMGVVSRLLRWSGSWSRGERIGETLLAICSFPRMFGLGAGGGWGRGQLGRETRIDAKAKISRGVFIGLRCCAAVRQTAGGESDKTLERRGEKRGDL